MPYIRLERIMSLISETCYFLDKYCNLLIIKFLFCLKITLVYILSGHATQKIQALQVAESVILPKL